ACIPHPFPFLFFAAPPPIPLRRKASGRKEMGAVCFAASSSKSSERSQSIHCSQSPLSPSLRRPEALPYPRLVVIRASAHTMQAPRTSTLAFARAACSVFASCSLCGSDDVRGYQKTDSFC
ncbi:MAG: hypothetical protein UT73_C0001G0172, partial [Candidatus Nomurabacteria bacterium GW2011_GWB1_40_11]